jgi:hypothetical protein
MIDGQTARLVAIFSMTLTLPWTSRAQQQEETSWEDDDWEEEGLPVEIHGFAEGALAHRVKEDPVQSDDFLLGEARFRLDLSYFSDRVDLEFKGDLIADGVADEIDGDIRLASVTLRTVSWLDVRAGRQVLTWGTGDLVFLNDPFPKDFVSFFIGREDEFLKAPSNSLKLTFYTGPANLDVVWSNFAPDRFITGERLSFFDPEVPGLVSAETMGGPLEPRLPSNDLGELALRLFGNRRGYELAAYGHLGFFKQPVGFDPDEDVATFPPLAVYGGSARGTMLGGITSLEGAYYDSLDDREGTDPNTPNSQLRGLVGHERELFRNFTAALQYYLEWTLDYGNLIASSPWPQYEPPERRHLFTTRLTHRLLQQTLTLSLFVFAAPWDGDGYLKPVVTYNWTDSLTVAGGANILLGPDPTFFGQVENNSNVFARVRYSF